MTPRLAGDLGSVDAPGFPAYPDSMDILTDATQLPKDPASLPDDAVINAAVWAALQGVELATVYRNKTKADRRRGTDDERPGDMPAEDGRFGHGPYWLMSTYRRWSTARPGKGAGAGRPAGTGHGRAVRVKLPLVCPHCQHGITREDLDLDESGRPVQPATVTVKAARRLPAGRKRHLAVAPKP